jgi:hypothetical protein
MFAPEVQFDDAQLRSILGEIDRRTSSNTPAMSTGLRQAAAIYLGEQRRNFDVNSRGGGSWPDLAESTNRGRLAKQLGVGRARDRLRNETRTLADEFENRRKLQAAKDQVRLRVLRVKLGQSRDLTGELRTRQQIARLLARSQSTASAKRRAKTIRSASALGKFAILADTGTLRNSIGLGAPNSIERPIEDGIRVGTAVKYAIHHQEPKRPGRPPQRKILTPPSPDTNARMRRVIAAAITSAINGSQ